MPDPRDPEDDEVIGLTRVYLTRRRGQPPPPHLEDDALRFALSPQRSKRSRGVLGGAILVVTTVAVAVAVVAVHGIRPAAVPGSTVQITRTPGLLALPPLEVTITDTQEVADLSSDIQSLPQGHELYSCPISWGTSYSLTFSSTGTPSWTAIIPVWGCGLVTLSNGPERSALNATTLWSDLGNALGLVTDQVEPYGCGAQPPPSASGTCYPTVAISPSAG
jgi:hypothetical protein